MVGLLRDEGARSFPPAEVQTSLRLAIGAASPLWLLFGGVVTTGAAYWLMTRWLRPSNLEAGYGTSEPRALPAPAPALETSPAAEAAVAAPEPAAAEEHAIYEPGPDAPRPDPIALAGAEIDLAEPVLDLPETSAAEAAAALGADEEEHAIYEPGVDAPSSEPELAAMKLEADEDGEAPRRKKAKKTKAEEPEQPPS